MEKRNNIRTGGLFAILSILLLTNCTVTKIGPAIWNVECDFSKISDVNDSGIITDVNIVSLQDTSVYLNEINKIAILDTIVYLLDKEKNSLYVFTNNGKYIHTISDQGHGANEYLMLSDFCIDKKKQTINVLSRLDKKIFIYDKFGKNLIEVKALPKQFFKIEKRKEGYIGYMGNYTADEQFPYNYWLMDENFSIIGQFGEINTNLESRVSNNLEPFSQYDGTLHVLSEFSRDVICLKDSDIQASTIYKYDFGKCNLPSLSSRDYADDRKMFEIKNTYIANPIRFQETDRYILSLVLYQGQYKLIVYDKKKSMTEIVSLDAYTQKYLFSFGNVVYMNEKEIYTIIDAKNIYDVWIGYNEFNNFEKEYPSQVENLRKDIKSVNADGNPFLVIYKIQ